MWTRGALGLLAIAAPGVQHEIELSADPRAGDAWRTSFQQRLELRLEEVVYQIDEPGQPSEPHHVRVDGVERTATRSLSWIDHHLAVDGAELRGLRRSYGRLERHDRTKWTDSTSWNRRHGGSSSVDGQSALSEKTILFEWDARSEEFHVEPEPFEYVDRDQLDALRADVSLCELLPGRPVEVGDAWRVGPSVLLDLLEPGGSIRFESSETSLFDETLDGATLRALEDELRIILVEIEEDDGSRLARLDLEGRLEVSAPSVEISELVALLGYPVSGVGSRAITLELALEGQVAWDLEAHHWRSVRTAASVSVAVEDRLDASELRWQFRTTTRYRGELTIDASCDR